MIKPAYSVSFLLSINIFVWQNVLYFPKCLRSIKQLISLGLQNLLFLNLDFGGCSPNPPPLLPWVCPCPGARRLNRMESVTCISITKTSLSILCSEIPHLTVTASAFCGQNVGFCGTNSNGGLVTLTALPLCVLRCCARLQGITRLPPAQLL